MALLLHLVTAGALTWALVPLYARIMRGRGRLDTPSVPSMHAESLPVGVGVIPISLTLVFWLTNLGSVSMEQISLML